MKGDQIKQARSGAVYVCFFSVPVCSCLWRGSVSSGGASTGPSVPPFSGDTEIMTLLETAVSGAAPTTRQRPRPRPAYRHQHHLRADCRSKPRTPRYTISVCVIFVPRARPAESPNHDAHPLDVQAPTRNPSRHASAAAAPGLDADPSHPVTPVSINQPQPSDPRSIRPCMHASSSDAQPRQAPCSDAPKTVRPRRSGGVPSQAPQPQPLLPQRTCN